MNERNKLNTGNRIGKKQSIFVYIYTYFSVYMYYVIDYHINKWRKNSELFSSTMQSS